MVSYKALNTHTEYFNTSNTRGRCLIEETEMNIKARNVL